MIQLVFSCSIGLVFVISALSKMFSYKKSIESIVTMDLFDKKINKIIGVLFPFYELFLGISIFMYYPSLILNIVGVSTISIFIFMNIRGLIAEEEQACHCFGNVMKTKLGLGGVAQTSFMLVSLLPNLFIVSDHKLSAYLDSIEMSTFLATLIFIYTATIFLVRTVIDFEDDDKEKVDPRMV